MGAFADFVFLVIDVFDLFPSTPRNPAWVRKSAWELGSVPGGEVCWVPWACAIDMDSVVSEGIQFPARCLRWHPWVVTANLLAVRSLIIWTVLVDPVSLTNPILWVSH
jgi:hypothetical protein